MGNEVLGALFRESVVLGLGNGRDRYLGIVRGEILKAPIRVTFGIKVGFFDDFVDGQELHKYRLIIILLQKELRIVLILNPRLIQRLSTTTTQSIILPILAPTDLLHLQRPEHVKVLQDDAIDLLDEVPRGRTALVHGVQAG